jgi:hypothetical protein
MVPERLPILGTKPDVSPVLHVKNRRVDGELGATIFLSQEVVRVDVFQRETLLSLCEHAPDLEQTQDFDIGDSTRPSLERNAR